MQRAPLNKPQLQPTCISFWLSGQKRLEQLLQSFLLLLYVLTCLIGIETSAHTHLPIACEYLCTGALAAADWAWHPTSSVSMSVMFQIAVAGAHLSGLALNHQLLDLGARLVRTVRTAPVYRECLQQRAVLTGISYEAHMAPQQPRTTSCHHPHKSLLPLSSTLAGMYSLGPKPALIREPQGSKSGKAIELEVWEMPIEKVG